MTMILTDEGSMKREEDPAMKLETDESRTRGRLNRTLRAGETRSHVASRRNSKREPRNEGPARYEIVREGTSNAHPRWIHLNSAFIGDNGELDGSPW